MAHLDEQVTHMLKGTWGLFGFGPPPETQACSVKCESGVLKASSVTYS